MMTPQQVQAIKQHMAKPKPYSDACGCLGPQVINPATAIRGKYGSIIGARYPLCPCMMRIVEEVEGRFYRIGEVKRELGYDYTAEDIGAVGGPYTCTSYGQPGIQARADKTDFRVTVLEVGERKVDVIKAIRSAKAVTLIDAKHMLDKVPATVYYTEDRYEAEAVFAKLAAVGATVELQ